MAARQSNHGVPRCVGLIHLIGLRENAFATLTAVCLLLLAAAFLAGSVLSSQQLLLERNRAEKAIEVRSATWKAGQALLTALQETWNADEQTLDVWWVQHSAVFPAGSSLISLSARVNLNTMSPFLLKDSELNATLLGRSVEDFTTYRINEGPFSKIEDYKDFFKPANLNAMYCVHSHFNVNTADEIMLEKVLAAHTGSESLAASIHARLREFRTNRQVLAQSDWDALIGADKDTIGELVTVNPELDVNTVPPDVLYAILRDPDFKLEHPDAKVQSILASRGSKPLTSDILRQILGVGKNSLLLQYLGTRTYFVQGKIPEAGSVMTFVATVTYSSDSPPKIALRILDTEWTSS